MSDPPRLVEGIGGVTPVAAPHRLTLRLITVVWGAAFVDLFLRVTARSLLADGNLAELARRHSLAYTIHTTPEDAAILRASPWFERLAAAASVELAPFDTSEIDPADPSSHWILWRRATHAAKAAGETVFLIIPDVLFAAGTLVRWAGYFERGYRAICTPGPHLVLDTTLAEIEERFPPAAQEPVAYSVPELHSLLLRQLHPMLIAMSRGSDRWALLRHPDTILVEVPGEGLVLRIIGSQPFCFDPAHFELNDAFCPLDRLEDIAFDETTIISLEPILKFGDFHYVRGPLGDNRLSNMGRWIDHHHGPTELLWAMRDFRIRGRGAAPDERAFRRAEAGLSFLMCQMRLIGAVYRVVQAMRNAGCGSAARIVAAAHFAARLRRRWRIKGPVTLAVPRDAALEGMATESLFAEGREKELAETILAHVVPGEVPLRVGEAIRLPPEIVVAENGVRYELAAQQAIVVAGPVQVDDCTIYVVDRPLVPIPPRPAQSSLLPNLWMPSPARIPKTSVAPGPAEPPATSDRLQSASQRIQSLLARLVPGQDAPDQPGPGSASAPPVAAPAIDRAARRAAVETLQRIQLARMVVNVAELLRRHRGMLARLDRDCPPLAMVEACLAEAEISDRRLVRELEDLVELAPDFAEAWLELGLAQLDRDRADEALRCFDRCLGLSAYGEVPPGRIRPAAMAAFMKARTLERQGDPEAAAAAYQAGVALDAGHTLMRVEYGFLLRRLGRLREAIVEFETGMHTDGTALVLPSPARNFAATAARLVESFGGDRQDGLAARTLKATVA